MANLLHCHIHVITNYGWYPVGYLWEERIIEREVKRLALLWQDSLRVLRIPHIWEYTEQDRRIRPMRPAHEKVIEMGTCLYWPNDPRGPAIWMPRNSEGQYPPTPSLPPDAEEFLTKLLQGDPVALDILSDVLARGGSR